MKITKQIESEIKLVMNDYWESYIKGDLDHWANYLINDYRNIGTTEVEIWNSKKEIYNYTTSVVDQMVGFTEIRNKKTEIIPYEPYIMVHEYLDIYIKVEEKWTFYSKLRLSSLIQKIDNAWKILHQHGSYPDSKVNDGEFFAFDKLKSENLKLQDAVKNRTLELQAKNRDLEIEGSLERIRSVCLGMRKADDLMTVSEVLLTELKTLGFESIRNTQIDIFDDDKGSFLNYEYSDYGVVGVTEVFYDSHPLVEQFVKDVRSVSDALSYLKVTGPDLDEWRSHRKQTNHLPDPQLEKAETLYYYCYSIETGALGLSTYAPLNEEKLNVLKRFRNVFNLAYTRYLDIIRAEAQAREAKIEASLERVRAQAMAMHNSNDISNAMGIVFEELENLKIKTIRCGILIIDTDKHMEVWTAASDSSKETIKVIDRKFMGIHPLLDGAFEAWKNQQSLYTYDLRDQDLKDYYQSIITSDYALPNQHRNMKKQFFTLSLFTEGGIYAFTEHSPPAESINILRRITDVFDLTYRRYLDLNQAESQAREAEQQAALDRVRAEIASMRTTKDLEKITPFIWNELTNLGMSYFRCGIFIIDESDLLAHGYLSNPFGKSLGILHLKIGEGQWIDEATSHWRNGKIYHDMWSRDQFIEWTLTMIEQGFVENREHFQDGIEAPDNLFLQLLPFAQGMLYVGTNSPLSKEDIELAQKVADAFGVAYARYEDFQKLEEANKRKSLELEEARQLQLAMLPKDLPKLPKLEIAVYMQTATEVGGDYYDFHVGEDGVLTAVIGDATGHGMKAGTIVTITKSLFNSLASSSNILNTFSKISNAIKDMNFKQLSMCLTMLKIDGNKYTVSSAAMPPIYIYRKKTNSVEELEMSGMPLGSIRDFPYEVHEGTLDSGDTIIMLSDGLPELNNERKMMYGYDKVVAEFDSVGNEKPEKIVKHLKNSASNWAKGSDAEDDITFVVIKVK